jgi:hypothetical protein
MRPNQLLARQVMDFIEQNPQHHNQEQWHCGSSHCYAGFVEVFANAADPTRPFKSEGSTQEFAIEQLQISQNLAEYWFSGNRSKSELADLTAAFCGEIDDHRSAYVRIAIAERADLTPELTTKLAGDDSAYVRIAIAERADRG